MGERDDLLSEVVQNTLPQNFPSEVITLNAFWDVNAHLGYRFNNQLSVFVKGNNLTNSNYQRWANYPVQGLQVIAGATYKFDL
jgi:outer membrane receptor protein involved in Fe transport